ncbi:MAG: hypothetical protein MUC96_00570 [Myxococcaceae bacterium]|nr:hypothetical protein [Myxococcaceae bacterium]
MLEERVELLGSELAYGFEREREPPVMEQLATKRLGLRVSQQDQKLPCDLEAAILSVRAHQRFELRVDEGQI